MGLEERKQSKQIGDFTYSVTPVPFGVGRKALVRLIGVVSPVLSAAFKGGDSKETVAAVLGTLPASLSDDDLKYFSDLFGPYSEFQQGAEWTKLTSAQQDIHFAGRYLEYTKWLIFACEVNFSGFFSGITGEGGLGPLRVTNPAKEA